MYLLARGYVLDFSPPVEFRIEVDEEGVCRVVDCTVKVVRLTPADLGRLITAVVKALGGPEAEDQRIDVNLN